MSPGFGLVQAPAYVWPAALSSAIRGGGSDIQGVLLCVYVYVCVCVHVCVSECVHMYVHCTCTYIRNVTYIVKKSQKT